MDFRLEKLKGNLESAVEGMSSEQWNWHPPGKRCAVEVLEHLYLTYTGTINGFERVLTSGKPLASRASMAQRVLTSVVVGWGHMPAGRKAPAIAQPRGLPAETVRNEIGAKIVATDAIIAQCEARFGVRPTDVVLILAAGPRHRQDGVKAVLLRMKSSTSRRLTGKNTVRVVSGSDYKRWERRTTGQ